MKGVILAGGLGTRLRPLTLVTNKHLLPVYDRPMIYYLIQCFLNAGIDEVLIVTGGEHAGDFLKLLKNGKHLGLRHLEYTYQEGEGGIAEALKLAEDFSEGGKICVILGDNIIKGNIRQAAGAFFTQKSGAKVLLRQVDDPERFGVPRFDDHGAITEICEKHMGILIIPPTLWHGACTVGQRSAGLMYYMTHPYDPGCPDEQRRPYDSVAGMHWGVEHR